MAISPARDGCGDVAVSYTSPPVDADLLHAQVVHHRHAPRRRAQLHSQLIRTVTRQLACRKQTLDLRGADPASTDDDHGVGRRGVRTVDLDARECAPELSRQLHSAANAVTSRPPKDERRVVGRARRAEVPGEDQAIGLSRAWKARERALDRKAVTLAPVLGAFELKKGWVGALAEPGMNPDRFAGGSCDRGWAHRSCEDDDETARYGANRVPQQRRASHSRPSIDRTLDAVAAAVTCITAPATPQGSRSRRWTTNSSCSMTLRVMHLLVVCQCTVLCDSTSRCRLEPGASGPPLISKTRPLT
ncbi:MAG: hypothetical protein QOJ85_3013 [Solirubrobacteraceae bacterium]|nr:hypothetical protein [Solirubrobacteraceae bacterium]